MCGNSSFRRKTPYNIHSLEYIYGFIVQRSDRHLVLEMIQMDVDCAIDRVIRVVFLFLFFDVCC